MGRIAGFFGLIRPVNGLMMGLAVIVGASLVLAEPLTTELGVSLLLGFATGFTLTAASMAINDYYDMEIDRINEPGRPLPEGVVKPNEALVFSAFLTAVGLAAAVRTSLSCLGLAAVAWVVAVSYNTKGKRTGLPGNFLVGACMAIPFFYGSLIVKDWLDPTALLFAAMALLSGTGREVAKGIVDVEGDRSKGIRTVAISHGGRAAAILASFFFLSAVLLSSLPVLLNLVRSWYVPFVVITDLGFIASSVLLVRNPSRANAKRIKNLVLVWMMLAMVSFFAGTL
jgi:geranylgeranylglycerol-phosphate geranylgeranyltransferase